MSELRGIIQRLVFHVELCGYELKVQRATKIMDSISLWFIATFRSVSRVKRLNATGRITYGRQGLNLLGNFSFGGEIRWIFVK